MLRIDDVQLTNVAGLRFNVWTSIVLFVLAAAYFVVVGRGTARAARRRSTSTAATDAARSSRLRRKTPVSAREMVAPQDSNRLRW